MSDRPRIEKIGPVAASVRSFAEEEGRKPTRWVEEPVPPSSLPADVVFPGTPDLRPGAALPQPRLELTTLPNGFRVATQETYGQIATFALFIDAGSMYEGPDEIGATHFLESTAFKATTTRSTEDILALTQAAGISTSSVFNREVLMLKVETLRAHARTAADLLADAALRPAFSEEDIATARQVIAFQRDEAAAQPQGIVTELLGAAAYGGSSPLGRPEKCPEERIGAITAETLRRYASRHLIAPRMVLAGVGVSHSDVVALAQEFFGGVPAAPPPGVPPPSPRPECRYYGGDVRVSPEWSALPPTVAAATAKTEYTHAMLAFPTVGWSHDDVVPVCVVDTLLGGGASFSAGGPGKGMYSRLYREVLNQFPWVESCNAFSSQLYDCGLVGIYGAAPPENAGDLAALAAQHLTRMCETPVRDTELRRARNQLASSVMMNLETRGLLVEDIGRQILSHGKRLDPAVLCKRIQAVTAEDIIRVMRQALAAPPALAVVGDASAMPAYDAFRNFFATSAQRFGITPGSAFVGSAGRAQASAGASSSHGRAFSSSSGGGTGARSLHTAALPAVSALREAVAASCSASAAPTAGQPLGAPNR